MTSMSRKRSRPSPVEDDTSDQFARFALEALPHSPADLCCAFERFGFVVVRLPSSNAEAVRQAKSVAVSFFEQTPSAKQSCHQVIVHLRSVLWSVLRCAAPQSLSLICRCHHRGAAVVVGRWPVLVLCLELLQSVLQLVVLLQ